MDKPSPYMDNHPPSENALFAQAEWVQGVVRAMVRDEHLAQDIAQDAMEAGLHAGSNKIRDPRAWLVGVVRNLHRQDARSGVRRRIVEQRKQQKVEEPSSEELLARLEVQQIVASAVMELPDPFRSVLILRFYEGAPIRTVAVRRGIDRKQAESQVRRGLTLLHRRLKGRLGEAWAVAVLPLALPATATAMTATVAGLAGAASAKVLFGVAAGALALVGFGYWGIQGPDDEDPSGEVFASAHVVEKATELPSPVGDPIAAASSSQEIDRSVMQGLPMVEGEWVVRGLLTDGENPAPHAQVVLEIRAGHDNSAPLIQEIPLESDARGRIAYNGNPPTGAIFVQLQSAHPKLRPSRSRGALVLPESQPPQDLGLAFHAWTREIRGVVTDEEGTPIADAVVRTAELLGKTDADGRFLLPAGPFGSSEFVYAKAPGFAQLMKLAYFQGEDENVAELRFSLPEEVVVRGRVVDSHGVPIPDVKIAKLMSRWESATTDHTGAFELRNLEAEGSSFELYAKKTGYAPTQILVNNLPAGTETRVDVVMTRGGILQGHVTDRAGVAIAAAKISISSQKHHGDAFAVYSGEDGFFRAEGVLPGWVDVRVDRPGFASIQRAVQVDAMEGQLLEMPISLLAGREIEVTVLDPEGNPLQWGWVSALKQDGFPRSVGGVRTNEAGQAVLIDQPAVELSLEIGRHGFSKQVIRVNPEVDQLEVHLNPIPVLRGVVLDAETGEPIPKFRIQLTYVETGQDELGVGGISMELRGGREFQSATGEWEIRYDLEPHHWLGYYVLADGYTLYENLRVQMPSSGEAIHLVSELDRGATLSGSVMPRTGGAPIAGAKVTWVNPNQVPSDLQMSTRNPSTTTDAQGLFELEGVPEGDASLIIEHKDWARHLEGPISVSASDSPRHVRILLEEAVTLSGSVLSAEGDPMEAVRVTAIPEGLSAMRLNLTTSTDADGRFHIEGLPMASYRIQAEVQTGGLWWTLHLVDEQVIGADGLELILRRSGTGRITGSISAHDDLTAPLQVRAIKLDGDGVGDEYGGIAVDGSFEINHLPAGMYRVEMVRSVADEEQPDFPQSTTTKVSAEETVKIELETLVR